MGAAAKMVNHKDIDFDKELRKGKKTYDRTVGDWWLTRTDDPIHDRAYRNIAKRIRELVPGEPRLIVDYGCGTGHLLSRLVRRFPESRFIGIDGSKLMLKHAKERLERIGRQAVERVELIESALPNFKLAREIDADVIVYCFPNICPADDEQPYYDKHGWKNKADTAVAKLLSKAREKNPEDETVTSEPEDLFNQMMDNKVVTRNLRAMLRKGGHMVRIEYANADREELTDLVRMRCEFEEGAMGRAFEGKKPERIFKFVSSQYHPSKVIMDVYHQTGDESDMHGGYHINLFKGLDNPKAEKKDADKKPEGDKKRKSARKSKG